MYGGWSGAGASAASGLTGVGVNVVDEAVGHGFLSREPSVAVRVLLDLLKGLTGVLCDELCHLLLDVQHLLSLDLDVRGRAPDATGGLVHHHAGVRRGGTFAGGGRSMGAPAAHDNRRRTPPEG